ncbi:MAG: hypothetical protein IKQ10_08235 [Oscillospiraceae bacterium]|nr:hypothetical protein [Oscillospiraceae bacterium]
MKKTLAALLTALMLMGVLSGCGAKTSFSGYASGGNARYASAGDAYYGRFASDGDVVYRNYVSAGDARG